MSNPIKDGGPAFPLISHTDCNGFRREAQDGMSLRDYFAGQALAGWVATLDMEPEDEFLGDEKIERQHQLAVARWMYGYADAMLAARDKL